MSRFVVRILWLLYLLPLTQAFADKHYGIRLTQIAYPREICHLKGFQGMLLYEPGWTTKHFDFYVDGGYSHFWVKHIKRHKQLNAYSIAPIARYYFDVGGPFFPYAELSIGVAYLNHTYLRRRNLGIHFSFQDRVGFGTFIGQSQQIFVGFYFLHYSNAQLSKHNGGFTAPVVLDVGMRFE